jgi:hypothetical protein
MGGEASGWKIQRFLIEETHPLEDLPRLPAGCKGKEKATPKPSPAPSIRSNTSESSRIILPTEDQATHANAILRLLEKIIKETTNATVGNLLIYLFKNDFFPHLKLVSEKLFYYYDKETALWIQVKTLNLLQKPVYDVVSEVVTELADLLNERLEKEEDAEQEILTKTFIQKTEKFLAYLGKGSNVKPALEFAFLESIEPDFANLLNTKIDYIPVKKNMVVNLRTKKQRKRKSTDYFTFEIPVAYREDIDIEGPFFEFVSRFCAEDPVRIRLLQTQLGYSITGSTEAKCYFVMVNNTGNNGKSELSKVLSAILGPHMVSFPTIAVLTKKISTGTNSDLIHLMRHRLVFAPEPGERDRINVSTIKILTGDLGQDLNGKYEETGSKICRTKLWIGSNFPIDALDGSDASKNRGKICPAVSVFYLEEEQKIEYETKLKAGKADFLKIYKAVKDFNKTLTEKDKEVGLKWLVDGAFDYYQNGFPTEEFAEIPDVVTDSFVEPDNYSFEKFCKDHLVFSKKHKIQHSKLKALYNDNSGPKAPKFASFLNWLLKQNNVSEMKRRPGSKDGIFYSGIDDRSQYMDSSDEDD